MEMKKIKLYSLIAVLGLLFLPSGTNEFVEINTILNAIIEATPYLLLPGIIRTSINEMLSQSWGIGNIVIQHTAKIQFVSEDRYTWGDRSGLWNNMYNNLRNVQLLLELSERNNANNYRGISLIIR